MRPGQAFVGVVLAGVGAAAAVAAVMLGGLTDGDLGPRTVPLLASATLIVSGLAIAISPSAEAPRRPSRIDGTRANERAALWLLILAVIYVLAIDRIGYLAATALAAPAVFALFGVRRPWPLVAAAIAIPLALHLVFFRVLGVFLPLGRWFDVLDWVPL